jgi:hypothetical protein
VVSRSVSLAGRAAISPLVKPETPPLGVAEGERETLLDSLTLTEELGDCEAETELDGD